MSDAIGRSAICAEDNGVETTICFGVARASCVFFVAIVVAGLGVVVSVTLVPCAVTGSAEGVDAVLSIGDGDGVETTIRVEVMSSSFEFFVVTTIIRGVLDVLKTLGI